MRSKGGRLRSGRLADLKRIDPDRLGDVLEPGVAEIIYGNVEARLHLTVGLFGETDRAGVGDAFEPGGNIDAVAHQIAVGPLDDVAQMDADAEFDAAVWRRPALRSTRPFWTSMAQRTASTTLRKSMRGHRQFA